MVVNMYIKEILQRFYIEMRSMLLTTGGTAMCVIKRQKKKSLKCVPVIELCER